MRLLFAPFLSAAPLGAFPCAALRRAPEAGLRGALFGRALARESGRATASFRRAAGASPLVPPERTAPLAFVGAVSTLRAFVGAFDFGRIAGASGVLRTARSTLGAPARRGCSFRGVATAATLAGELPRRAFALGVADPLPVEVRGPVCRAATFAGVAITAREPAAGLMFAALAAVAGTATGFETLETVLPRRPVATGATAAGGTAAVSRGTPTGTAVAVERWRLAPSGGAGASVG